MTGGYLFTLDELQNATIAQGQEKTDITGRQGRKLSSLKKNKTVTISGNNGIVSGGLLELQTGSKFENKLTEVMWNDYLIVADKWNTINPAVNAWLQTDFIYNDMNEQMQTVARAMVSGLDFSKLGLTTAESIENYITDYIINPLYNSGADVRAAFADITNWQEELRNGEITFDEFSERVEGAFDDLLSSMSDEDAAEFANNFVAGFNAIGIAGNDFDDVVENIINNWGAVTGATGGDNGPATAVGDLAEEITNLKKAYDLLETAQKGLISPLHRVPAEGDGK